MVESSLQATQPECQGEDAGLRSAVSSGRGGHFSSRHSSALVTLGRERGLSWTRVFVWKAEHPPSPDRSVSRPWAPPPSSHTPTGRLSSLRNQCDHRTQP